jgi:hypothetical protein
VLYLGDWDWQGLQIEANTREVLEEYDPELAERWERLAPTDEQVGGPNLGLAELTIQMMDRRYRPSPTRRSRPRPSGSG